MTLILALILMHDHHAAAGWYFVVVFSWLIWTITSWTLRFVGRAV